MSSMTFPASGPFGLFGGARKNTARRTARATKPVAVVSTAGKQTAEAKSTWTTFLGDAFATWATGGRLPR